MQFLRFATLKAFYRHSANMIDSTKSALFFYKYKSTTKQADIPIIARGYNVVSPSLANGD